MTHSLHRQGTTESLAGDYVILIMGAKGVTRDGAAPKLKQCLEVLLKYNPVNWGDGHAGNAYTTTPKQVLEGMRDNYVVHAVFTDSGTVARVLEELRRLDTGLSVVVSGLFDRVRECARQAGLEPHSVNFSLGIHGNTASLPDDPTLMAIHTMCGHAMISFNLIRSLAKDVARGVRTAEDAAETMARNCHCGVFNTRRAAALIEQLAARITDRQEPVGTRGATD